MTLTSAVFSFVFLEKSFCVELNELLNIVAVFMKTYLHDFIVVEYIADIVPHTDRYIRAALAGSHFSLSLLIRF